MVAPLHVETEPPAPQERFLLMQKDIDAPADELREKAERHQKAAENALTPESKKGEEARAKECKGEATDIENDLA
jgi:hypothetical protein